MGNVFLLIIDRDKPADEIDVNVFFGPFDNREVAQDFVLTNAPKCIPNWGPWISVQVIEPAAPTAKALAEAFDY